MWVAMSKRRAAYGPTHMKFASALLLTLLVSMGAQAGFGDIDSTYANPPADCGAAILPLDDGGALVARYVYPSGLGVQRLQPDGSPDASWGNGGTVAYSG